jgi:hypothetical protein
MADHPGDAIGPGDPVGTDGRRAGLPFGDVELVSERTLAPFSEASRAAADNLLRKAADALARGDRERTERFVQRAVALPYDRREQGAPAAMAAAMVLYDAVTEALETSDSGDSRWLDAALAVLDSAAGWGRSEMQHVLVVIGREYGIGRPERARITQALDGLPERADLWRADLPPAALAEAVTEVLATAHAYDAARAGSGR